MNETICDATAANIREGTREALLMPNVEIAEAIKEGVTEAVKLDSNEASEAIKEAVREVFADNVPWSEGISDAITWGVQLAMREQLHIPYCQLCGYGETKAGFEPYYSESGALNWNHKKCRVMWNVADDDERSKMSDAADKVRKGRRW